MASRSSADKLKPLPPDPDRHQHSAIPRVSRRAALWLSEISAWTSRCSRNRPGNGREIAAKLKLDPFTTVLFNVQKRTNSLVPVMAKGLATFGKGDAMQFVYGADWSGLSSCSGSSSMN